MLSFVSDAVLYISSLGSEVRLAMTGLSEAQKNRQKQSRHIDTERGGFYTLYDPRDGAIATTCLLSYPGVLFYCTGAGWDGIMVGNAIAWMQIWLA